MKYLYASFVSAAFLLGMYLFPTIQSQYIFVGVLSFLGALTTWKYYEKSKINK